MFELHVNDTDVSSGSVAVSWCVNEEILELLKIFEVHDPMVILTIVPHDDMSKENRVVAPLKDLMAYVEVRHPGKNKIHGVICFYPRVAKKMLDKNRCYHNPLFCVKEIDNNNELNKNYKLHDPNQFISIELCRIYDYRWFLTDQGKLFVAEPIDVDVPKECFAEFPKWEQTWINLFWRNKAEDQCEYRRRRLFAYTVQPIVFLIDLMIRFFILLLSAVLLSKTFSLKYFNIFTYSIVDTAEESLAGKRAIHIPPIIFVAIFTRLYFAGYFLHGLGVILGLACLAGLFFLGIWTHELWQKRKSSVYWYTDESERQYLLCGGDPKMKLSDLPKHKRTIKLRIKDLKTKVCRPFAA